MRGFRLAGCHVPLLFTWRDTAWTIRTASLGRTGMSWCSRRPAKVSEESPGITVPGPASCC